MVFNQIAGFEHKRGFKFHFINPFFKGLSHHLVAMMIDTGRFKEHWLTLASGYFVITKEKMFILEEFFFRYGSFCYGRAPLLMIFSADWTNCKHLAGALRRYLFLWLSWLQSFLTRPCWLALLHSEPEGKSNKRRRRQRFDEKWPNHCSFKYFLKVILCSRYRLGQQTKNEIRFSTKIRS